MQSASWCTPGQGCPHPTRSRRWRQSAGGHGGRGAQDACASSVIRPSAEFTASPTGVTACLAPRSSVLWPRMEVGNHLAGFVQDPDIVVGLFRAGRQSVVTEVRRRPQIHSVTWHARALVGHHSPPAIRHILRRLIAMPVSKSRRTDRCICRLMIGAEQVSNFVGEAAGTGPQGSSALQPRRPFPSWQAAVAPVRRTTVTTLCR